MQSKLSSLFSACTTNINNFAITVLLPFIILLLYKTVRVVISRCVLDFSYFLLAFPYVSGICDNIVKSELVQNIYSLKYR